MDLLAALAIIWRRKAIAIPVFLISAFGGAYVVANVEPEYEASSAMVMLAPATATGPQNQISQVNPLAQFSPAQEQTAAIIAARISTDSVRKQFDARGLAANYEISEPGAPQFTITVVNRDQKIATTTITELQKTAVDELENIQREVGAPKADWLTIRPITEIQVAQSNAAKTRAIAAIAVLGILGTIGSAFLVEGIAYSNRRRRVAAAAAIAQASAAAPVVAQNSKPRSSKKKKSKQPVPEVDLTDSDDDLISLS